MDNRDWDELLAQARQVGKLLGAVFEGATGDDLDVVSALRHYPYLVLGFTAGAGLLTGFWIGQKSRRRLPPPPAAESKVLGYLEQLFPDGVEKVRQILPEVPPEEAAAAARSWLDNVLEPRLKQGLENVASSVPEGRLGTFLKHTIERLDKDEGESA